MAEGSPGAGFSGVGSSGAGSSGVGSSGVSCGRGTPSAAPARAARRSVVFMVVCQWWERDGGQKRAGDLTLWNRDTTVDGGELMLKYI